MSRKELAKATKGPARGQPRHSRGAVVKPTTSRAVEKQVAIKAKSRTVIYGYILLGY